MKRVSYYIFFLVIAGGAVVAFWAYQKYFKGASVQVLQFVVKRSDIQETVRVRGGVVAQKTFDMGFPFSGTVEKIYVSEGQNVTKGAPLVSLDTASLEIDRSRLGAILVQKQANLDKLIAGPTAEDVQVSQAKVASAAASKNDAERNMIDKLQDAYTKTDDAIRNKSDQFFSNPRGADPELNFQTGNSQLELSIKSDRIAMEQMLTGWQTSLGGLNALSDFTPYTQNAKTNLNAAAAFLNNETLALAVLTPTVMLSQTVIDGWRADIATARTNVNTAITNLSTAEEKLNTASSNLKVARDELALKKAGTRPEDIDIAKAQIQEIQGQIAGGQDQIKKSTLFAPAAAQVAKVWPEEHEVLTAAENAVTLFLTGYKVQADISELDIGKVHAGDGNTVVIKLDAFPDKQWNGKVVSIAPQEIDKEGDIFYRTDIYFEDQAAMIRSGMSADLTILGAIKKNVLTIPEFAVFNKDNAKFVKVLDGRTEKDIAVKTGISDGQSIEITDGLTEGQTVIVSGE